MSRKRLDTEDRSPRQARAAAAPSLPRRRVLAGASAVVSGAVAGCGALSGDGSPEDLTFSRLHQTPVYVADRVDLSMPDEVPTVTATNNADLIVLPGDTDIGAEQAVDWLTEERVLALLGETAEGTWLGWARSDDFETAFDERGYSDSEPDPELLVAAAVGLHVPTYRHSWADGPRERDVLRTLDEDLVDIETRTPR